MICPCAMETMLEARSKYQLPYYELLSTCILITSRDFVAGKGYYKNSTA